VFAVLDWMAHGHWPLALAVLVGLLNLLGLPSTHPPEERRSERSPAVAALGQWLIRLLWVARAATYAYVTYSVTNNADETSFQAKTAIAAGAAQAFTLLIVTGGHVAGFFVDWKFLRGWNALRYLLRIATGVLFAGYAGLLGDVVGTVVRWVPARPYDLFDRWLWSWAAALLTGVFFLLFVGAIVSVEGLLQSGAARLLGPDNAPGSWLEKHAPARLVLTDTECSFEYRFVVNFHWYGPRRLRPVRGRTRQRLALYEQPLGHDERQALVDRVADVLWADLPPRWVNAALTYRAAGDHEEVALRVNVWGPCNEQGVSVGEAQESRLTSFVEIESLRRLRAVGYEAGMGTSFQWVLSFDATRRSPRDEDNPLPRDRAWWRPSPFYEEPAWFVPPSRADYRDDLRRFPIVRRMRPGWLRQRLIRDAPVPPDDALTPVEDPALEG
jgi:hypothetical protein